MVSIELSPELIPGLPEEIGLDCLIRFHYSTYRVAARVCRRWQQHLQSRELHYLRKQAGYTRKAACLVQLLNNTSDSAGSKPIASSEGKLVVMGGWDPSSYDPVRDVFIYDFTTQRWRQGKQMPETRSFFAPGGFEGRIIVAGGHDENKNALSTAWEYDVNRDEWTELARMSQERDECQGMVIGSEFWVVSGYRTDNQGGFEGSAELMDLRTGEWRRIEEAWKESQCPRSCVGVGKEQKLFYWGDCDSAIRVGACAVPLGERTLVCGSAYQGGPQGFFLVEGHGERFKRIDVPPQFSGFVQSGCSLDI
ncbi:hypothetical protein ES319_A09G138000v1 [Gossypium barbadense]|uniref:Uncharacterized protein n=1 Tax=Gossypium barbadense TaxID=3634 RepID=A0A5J5UEC4_GOSBA|nr:hypothetical protein ES319_A09G138000v1 [Gossypium barbadense]